MSNFELECDYNAIGEQLLKSDWAMQVCTELATKIAETAGEGYEVSAHNGQNRVNVSVYTKDMQAEWDENNLLKAMGAYQ